MSNRFHLWKLENEHLYAPEKATCMRDTWGGAKAAWDPGLGLDRGVAGIMWMSAHSRRGAVGTTCFRVRKSLTFGVHKFQQGLGDGRFTLSELGVQTGLESTPGSRDAATWWKGGCVSPGAQGQRRPDEMRPQGHWPWMQMSKNGSWEA